MPAVLGQMAPNTVVTKPTSVPGLEVWYAAPPLGKDPTGYVILDLPYIRNPSDVTNASWVKTSCTTTDTQTITDTADSGVPNVHIITQDASSTNMVMRTTVFDVDVSAGTLAFIHIRVGGGSTQEVGVDIAGITIGYQGTGITTATVTDIDGTWRHVHLVATGLTATTIEFTTATDATAAGVQYAGVGTGSVKLRKVMITQDGTVSKMLDLSGHGRDTVNQITVYQPLYMGVLEADWSTGASLIRNQLGGSIGQLILPAELVGIFSGNNTTHEFIILLKNYGLAAGFRIPISFNGSTALTQSFASSGSNSYETYRKNDAGLVTVLHWALVAGNEDILSNVANATSMSLYHGSPPIIDTASPQTLPTGASTYTNGTILASPSSAFVDSLGLREFAIFSRVLTDAERAAVMAGMIARSKAKPVVSEYPVKPTSVPGLEVWYAAPPKGVDPAGYVELVKPAFVSPDDLTIAPWTQQSSVVTLAAGVTTPNGYQAFQLSPDTTTLTQHDVYQVVNTNLLSRKTIISAYAKAGTLSWLKIMRGTSGTHNGWFDLGSGVIGTQQLGTGAIESVGNGWYKCSYTFTNPSGGIAAQFVVVSGDVVSATSGPLTDSIFLAHPEVTQDGTVAKMFDLSGQGRDATQTYAPHQPWFMGDLEADWSTGAPSVKHPQVLINPSLMYLLFPSAFINAMSGPVHDWEVVTLFKMYGIPTASIAILFMYGPAIPPLWEPMNLHTGDYVFIELKNDAGALIAPHIAYSITGEAVASSAWDTFQEFFYHDSPPVAAPPVSAALTGTLALAQGGMLQTGGTTITDQLAIREAAIFSRVLTMAERTAVMAGMMARAL